MRPDRVDHERCDLCRLCIEICGRGIYEEVEGRLAYRPEGKCIDCGHCMAVCPNDALVFEDGSVPPEIDAGLLPSEDALLHLLRARRSTRRFKKETPPQDLLDRLAEAARCAPTGTNKQAVRIVFVTNPELLERLRTEIMARYAAYERHLSSAIKRFFLKTFVDKRLGDPGLVAYLKSFMDGWRGGRDVLLHRAPVLALVSAGPEASTPRDDCVIALYHMVLAAERIGLGSCLLGTVEAAFGATPRLNDHIGIPRKEKVLAAACFGFPAVKFRRIAANRRLDVRWL